MVIIVFNYDAIRVKYWLVGDPRTRFRYELVPLYPYECLVNGDYFNYREDDYVNG